MFFCCVADVNESQYIKELHKSHSGESIQMAAAYREDVNVAELRCRRLFVILSCCHDGFPDSWKKVSLFMGLKPKTLQMLICTEFVTDPVSFN